MIGISEDITDKMTLLEAQLAQRASEEMLKKKIAFLDIAAHELRTPITSLSLMLQFAQKKIEKGNPLTIDMLARLKGPADRLNKLVIDLLDMSRLERGLLNLFVENTDIGVLILKCVEEFRIQAPLREIIFNTPSETIMVELDALRITQVLSNLLDNAIKYATVGHIEVVLKEDEQEVVVSVCDKGPGISKKMQETVFSAFYRGVSDETIRTSGLGLGLSVCQAIIELHNGKIGILSDEGKGSTFYFTIPKRRKK